MADAALHPLSASPDSFFYPQTITPRSPFTSAPQIIAATMRNPLEMWTERAFTEDSFAVKWGARTFMHVMSPALARQVLLDDADCFKKSHVQDRMLKPALGEGLLTSDGQPWRQQRRAAAPAFRHEALQSLVPAMASAGEEAANRLRQLTEEGRGKVDIHDEMMLATFNVIAETLLSTTDMPPDYTQGDLLQDVGDFLETVGRFNLLDVLDAPEWIPRFLANPAIFKGEKAIGRIRAFAKEQIRKRQMAAAPGEDLLGLMIAARDPETGDQLNDIQLLDNLVTFIGAGHETTALALTWAISIISHLPELQDQLAEEAAQVLRGGDITAENVSSLGLHERVLMETLRLYPPAAAIPRSVQKPVTVDGQELKEGDHVVVAVYPLQRHQKVWENPNAFDPDRFLPEAIKQRDRYAWIPFGAGPRICIGMKLSLMEAVTIFASLTSRFRFKPDASHEIIPKLTVTLRPKGGMPVFVEQR